ncbi:Protein of unknown function DUF2910 [Rhodococcus rhodochrous ATCC 21198]|nr:GAP family protein [Rhodococcus aetherivorans]ETT23753.1 Protein of unknown function DUF2910 [Rhodococcus rhodochrous ATCC 21198]NGP28843.1 hypothetical protein [Rhodococcus aetherivorans]
MDLALLGTLAVLALVDSTSLGTLVVPLWLLTVPGRPPVRRLLVYLLSIAAFYFVVGLVLMSAGRSGAAALARWSDTTAWHWAQLSVGAALFAVSWRFDSGKARVAGRGSRLRHWRCRALERQRTASGVAVLALGAGTVEVATMLPYLAAIGTIVATGLPAATGAGLLAGYCAVMVLPALLLVVGRLVVHRRIEPLLRRLDEFTARHADSALGWVLGIAGFLIARDAAAALFFAD